MLRLKGETKPPEIHLMDDNPDDDFFAHISVPYQSSAWLSTLPEDMSRYGELLDRHGFETTFALGLLESADDLKMLGMWEDDAEVIARYLYIPRRLVAYWSPMMERMPVSTSVEIWLSGTPVPSLVSYAAVLAPRGFDIVATLRHIQPADCKGLGIPEGHVRALCHVAKYINVDQPLPPAEAPLGEWLMHLNPSMEHYEKTLELEGVTRPVDLRQLSKEQWDRLIMKPGHKRTLRHYTVLLRTHWYDPL